MFSKVSFAWLIGALCMLALVSSPVLALGVDIPRPKKDKKKDDKKADTPAKDDSAKKDDSGAKKDDPNAQYAADFDEVLKAVEPMIEKALAAYNADDWKAFYADYAKSMAGIATEQAYNTLYGRYKSAFGKYSSKTLVKAKSSLTKTTPGLVMYDGVFEKNKNVQIAINVIPEEGVFKLMQVQFNAADGTNPLAAPVAGGVTEVKVAKSLWDKSSGDFKVGDWVEYEYPMAPGMKMRQEVVEVGDHTLVMSAKSTMNGNTTEAKSKLVYSEPDPEKVQQKDQKWETKEFADKVAVPGKGEVSATRYETYVDGKLTGKAWISKEVPLGGMVKGESPEGKPTMILTGFGRK